MKAVERQAQAKRIRAAIAQITDTEKSGPVILALVEELIPGLEHITAELFEAFERGRGETTPLPETLLNLGLLIEGLRGFAAGFRSIDVSDVPMPKVRGVH